MNEQTNDIIKTERRLFTYEERKEILKSSNGKCACCGLPLTTKTMTVEHIIPIYRGGTNDMKNLTALCETCNKDKGDILYLPRSFYSALIGTSRLNQMDDMVREWFKTYKSHHDIERYPLIAPKHNTVLNPFTPTNRRAYKIPYNRQLIIYYQLINNETYDEVEAISGVNLKTVRNLIQKLRPDVDADDRTKPHYELYKPVTFYALRKLSNDKLLGLFALRYDKESKDLIVYVIWTDMTKKSIGSVADNIIGCAFDAIQNIAEEQIEHYVIMSYLPQALDRYREGRTFYSRWAKAEEKQFHDTISNETLYSLIVYLDRDAPEKHLSDFIHIPKWLEEIKHEE